MGCWRGEACAFGHSFEMMEKKCRRPRKETREKIKEIAGLRSAFFCLWPGFGEVQFPMMFLFAKIWMFFRRPRKFGGKNFPHFLTKNCFPPPGRGNARWLRSWLGFHHGRPLGSFFSRHRSGDSKSKIVDAKFCISWWSSQGFKEKLGSPENLLGLPPQFPTLLIICVPRMIPSNFWRLTLPSSMEIGNRTTTDHRKPLPSRSAFACALSSTSIRIPGRWWARSQSPPNGIFCSEDSIPRFQGFCEKSTCPHSPILYWALMLVYDPERHTSWEDQNFPH